MQEWIGHSEHQCTKYWCYGISVPRGGNPYQWHYNDACRTLDGAIEAINSSRERGDIATAWVADDAGAIVYHASYINVFGDIETPTKRSEAKEGVR